MSAIGVKQSRKGLGRRKASRCWESTKALHSRVVEDPAQVAARCFTRCRGDRPQERRPRKRRSGSGQTLEQDEVHERIQAGSSRYCLLGTRGKTP